MYELLVERHLFNTEAKCHWTEEDDHLVQMLEMINTLQYPVGMLNSAKRCEEFFDESDCLIIMYLLTRRRFETDPRIEIYIIRENNDICECRINQA